jgi:hypothetical protein
MVIDLNIDRLIFVCPERENKKENFLDVGGGDDDDDDEDDTDVQEITACRRLERRWRGFPFLSFF